MSVFTPVQFDELETFLQPFALGGLQAFEGIEAGAENSNFFVHLDSGTYVLTLVERGSAPQALAGLVQLVELLDAAGLPVATPLRCQAGKAVHELVGRPALLQRKVEGRHVVQATAAQCRALGEWLAQMHRATVQVDFLPENDRGMAWILATAQHEAEHLSDEQRRLLQRTTAEITQHLEGMASLPRSAIHGDLFRDNTLFIGDFLGGVLDFHNACLGPMLLDLAICANDWCVQSDGQFEPSRLDALLVGYQQHRVLNAAEQQLWPTLLRAMALRFWLSRLLAVRAFAGQSVLIKDPQEFQQILQARFSM